MGLWNIGTRVSEKDTYNAGRMTGGWLWNMGSKAIYIK